MALRTETDNVTRTVLLSEDETVSASSRFAGSCKIKRLCKAADVARDRGVGSLTVSRMVSAGRAAANLLRGWPDALAYEKGLRSHPETMDGTTPAKSRKLADSGAFDRNLRRRAMGQTHSTERFSWLQNRFCKYSGPSGRHP